MTRVERRLAWGIVASWMVLSICTTALRIWWRISTHKPVYPVGALLIEQEWLVQGLAAAVLAVYTWRNRNRRFRFVWFSAVSLMLFGISEVVNVGTYLPLRRFIPLAKASVTDLVVSMVIVDITHFFILSLGTIAVVLMIHSYRDSLDAEREAASIEASLAEARVRNLRNQVQPGLIRESLQTIEELLPDEPERAEAALLNLSDFLRVALVRAARPGRRSATDATHAHHERDTGVLAS